MELVSEPSQSALFTVTDVPSSMHCLLLGIVEEPQVTGQPVSLVHPAHTRKSVV